MPKIPESVPVKVSVSKVTLEVPKAFFEHSALKAAIFVGRKGRAAATRRTKWFTLADPSLLPTRTRQSIALSTVLPGSSEEAPGQPEAPHTTDVMTEMAVLEFSGVNDVVYEVDMKPLNIFDGDWVFDQKTTHPLNVFAKILCHARPGVTTANGKSEQESNMHEMMMMDQDDMDSEEDGGADRDNFSEDRGDSGLHGMEGSMSLSGIGLTETQVAALTGYTDVGAAVLDQLRRGDDCKPRYLKFPKTIDVATIVNTKAKTVDYCERLSCKNAALLGSTLSFTVTAVLPHEQLGKFEDKVKSKAEKEDAKRRAKEEKVLEMERKKAEKEEKKRSEKEGKGAKQEENYGADVTDTRNTSGNGNTFAARGSATSGGAAAPPSAGETPKKRGLSAIELVKGIFIKEEKPHTTPFTVKLTSTPFPFMIVLSDFRLEKLIMDPVNYRAVHIRLGDDAFSTEEFPRLMLDATKLSARTESVITWYDGSMRSVVGFDFGKANIFFGDRAIRNITGFETLRALQEHERVYREKKSNGTADRETPTDGDLFREQLMNVGTHFHPVTFESSKYSSNGNQARVTKLTRVTAQLIVADKVVGIVRPSDNEEKREYINKLKREQRQREKAEKERIKAEKEAEKASKKAAEKKAREEEEGADKSERSAEEHDDAASTTSEHEDNGPVSPGPEAAAADSGEGADAPAADGTDAEAHLQAAEEAPATPLSTKKEKKEKREKDSSRLVVSRGGSFQLSSFVVNEDYMPADGIEYRVRFATGEELSFRARRFFLPSVCAFGAAGCTREKTLDQYLNTTE